MLENNGGILFKLPIKVYSENIMEGMDIRNIGARGQERLGKTKSSVHDRVVALINSEHLCLPGLKQTNQQCNIGRRIMTPLVSPHI